MKQFKKVISVVTCIMLMLAAVAGCGSTKQGAASEGESSVAGTYTMEMKFSEFAENSNHGGYLGYSGSDQTTTQTNTLELKEDGTYVLTKHMEDTGMLLKVDYSFTGSYTAADHEVTLKAADQCTYSEDWGNLSGYIDNIEGEDSTDAEILAVFPTQYYAISESGNADVVVTVKDDGTFAYN